MHTCAQSQNMCPFMCTRQACTLLGPICLPTYAHMSSYMLHAYAHFYKCVHTLVNSKGTNVTRLVIRSVTLAAKDSQVYASVQDAGPTSGTSSRVLINPVYPVAPFLPHTGVVGVVSLVYTACHRFCITISERLLRRRAKPLPTPTADLYPPDFYIVPRAAVLNRPNAATF